jgi:hypothetical protein
MYMPRTREFNLISYERNTDEMNNEISFSALQIGKVENTSTKVVLGREQRTKNLYVLCGSTNWCHFLGR